MPFHTLGATLAPFHPHVPGGVAPAIRRAGPPSHWPSGRGIPGRHRSGALPAPAQPVPESSDAPGLRAVHHVPPLRRTAQAGGGAWSMGDKFLGSARLPAVATRAELRGFFPSPSPGKVLKASLSNCIPRPREEGGTGPVRPWFSRVTAFERQSPWAQAAGKAQRGIQACRR